MKMSIPYKFANVATVLFGLALPFASVETAWANDKGTDQAKSSALSESDKREVQKAAINLAEPGAIAEIKETFWQNLQASPESSILGTISQAAIQTLGDTEKLALNYSLPNKVIPGEEMIHVQNMSFSFSTPISDSESKSEVPNLSKMVSASTIDFSYTRTIYPNLTGDVLGAFEAGRQAWDAALEKLPAAYKTSDGITAACISNIDTWMITPAGISRSDSADTRKQKIADWKASASVSEIEDAFQQHLGQGLAVAKECVPTIYKDHVQKQITSIGWVNSFNVNAKFGQDDFSYLEDVTLQSFNDTKSVYSLGAKYLRVKKDPEQSQFMSIGLDYEHAFEQAQAMTKCRPDDSEDCATGIFGPPAARDRFIANAKYHSTFTECAGSGCVLGYEINIHYDINDNVFGVDAPIYLFQNSDQNLTGGFRTGWRSDTEEVELGFFVGTKFYGL